jgi:hypothetical protein
MYAKFAAEFSGFAVVEIAIVWLVIYLFLSKLSGDC